MTFLNVISICVTVAIVTAAIMLYRRARREIADADGLGDVNTRGEYGENDGDVVAVIGADASDEDAEVPMDDDAADGVTDDDTDADAGTDV